MGPVKHIEIKENEVRTIYLQLDDEYAGKITMCGSDVNANNKWVPVKREETSIYFNIYRTPPPAIKKNTISFSAILGMSTSQVVGFSFNFSSCHL